MQQALKLWGLQPHGSILVVEGIIEAYFTTFSSSTHQLLSPVPGAFWICLSHSIERENRSAHGFITFQRGIHSSLVKLAYTYIV